MQLEKSASALIKAPHGLKLLKC